MDLETRIGKRFAALKAERRAGLVTFVTAGDPDLETSKEILFGLPGAGADLIEIGMPFSDPMAAMSVPAWSSPQSCATRVAASSTRSIALSGRKRAVM